MEGNDIITQRSVVMYKKQVLSLPEQQSPVSRSLSVEDRCSAIREKLKKRSHSEDQKNRIMAALGVALVLLPLLIVLLGEL